MNKLLIVLLALCLVTVHAFVKRDAPAPSNDNFLNELQKTIKDFAETVDAKIRESLNPEEVKKNYNAVLDSIQNSFNQLKANSETAKN